MTITQSLILYAGVLLLSGILLIFSKKYKDNLYLRYIFLILGLFPLFFILAFRYDVGTDYFYTYIPGFNLIMNGEIRYPNEPGFEMINKFLQVFTNQAQSIIIFTSFIYVLLIGLIIDEEDMNPLLALFVLFGSTLFFVFMNNVRQQLAAILVLWGYRFVTKHNFWAYAGVIITATFFFHFSALMLIFIYPLVNFKLLRKISYIWMPLCLILSPFMVSLYVYIMKMLGYGEYLEIFPIYEQNYLPLYKNVVIFLIIVMGFGLKNIYNDNKIYGLVAIQFAAIMLSIFTAQVQIEEINERVTFYFMIFQFISVPLAIKQGFKTNKWLGIYLLVSTLWFGIDSFYDHCVVGGYQEVLPYQFVFDHWKELIVPRPEKPKMLFDTFINIRNLLYRG